MDTIGKKLLLSAGIGLGVAVSSVSLYLLLKPEDEEELVLKECDKRKVRQSTQSVLTVRVPKTCVGAVIGRGGEHIKQIQSDTNTKIQFDDQNAGSGDNGVQESRVLVIRGSPESTIKAETMINDVIRHQSLVTTKTFNVETTSVGAIIGRNGQTIRGLCDKSGAKIKVDSKSKKTNAIMTSVTIIGTDEQIQEAVLLINKEITQNDKFLHNRHQSSAQKQIPNYKVLAIEGEAKDGSLDLDNYYAKLEPINEYQLVEVFVSSVKSPDQFYVQIAGLGAQELDHFMEESTDFYENDDNRISFKPLSVKVGDIVAVPYAGDEHWYRARVLSIEDKPYSLEESKVSVFYLDYGDEAIIKYKQICDLKDQLLKRLPFQAIQCSLSGVRPKNGHNWSEETTNKFIELSHMALWKPLFAKVIEMKTINGKRDKYVIELIDKNPNTDGNKGMSNEDDWNDTPKAKPLNIGTELIDKDFAVAVDE